MINNVEIMEIDLRSDPYQIIHNFINEAIIPKYDCLIRCDRFNVDEMGYRDIEFFIRYCPKMPYEKEKELNHLIYRDIHDFCKENDLYDEFLEITFFVTVAGDCSGYK